MEQDATEQTPKDDFILLQFEIRSKDESPEKVFEYGRKIISNKFKHPKIYHILIDSLISGGSRFERIEDMAFEAAQAFPDMREEFLAKVKDLNNNATVS